MKRSKYGVSSVADRTLNGKVYMSKLEKNYRVHLNVLSKATDKDERVVKIEEQVPFEIVINGQKICKYILDFKVEYHDGEIQHVDIKGMTTGSAYQMYRLKKKLVEACYPIKIREVKKGEF